MVALASSTASKRCESVGVTTREIAPFFLALVFTIAGEKWTERTSRANGCILRRRLWRIRAGWRLLLLLLALALLPSKCCQIKVRLRQSPPQPHPAHDKLCAEERRGREGAEKEGGGIGIKSRLQRIARRQCFGRSWCK